MVYAIESGTRTAPAGRVRFYNIKTGLGATNAYYDVGTNCSAPRGGSGGGTRVSSPFTPESFPRGFVRLRFPSAGGAPAAGAVQVIEYYLPLEVTVSILGTTVITDADHSAGLLRYPTAGCPTGESGCLTDVSDTVAPTISRPCAPVAAGTVSGTSLTWASCRVSPPAPCSGTSCGPSNAQPNWAQANSQDTLSSAGCLTNISSWDGVFCRSGLCGFVPGTGARSNLTWDQVLPTMTFGSTAYGAAGTTLTPTEHIVPDAFNDVCSGVSVTAVAVRTECGVASARGNVCARPRCIASLMLSLRSNEPMIKTRWMGVLPLGLALFGCSSEATSPADAATPIDTPAIGTPDVPAAVDVLPPVDVPAAVDVPPAMFTLTSTAYDEGGTIPRTHACTAQMGGNISPPLAWSGAPAGAMSFAIFFKDQTTAFRHSAIYDIPSSLSELPESVARTAMPANVPGARQPRGYPGTVGYAGPCPGTRHTYRFTIYAIDVEAIPELTPTSNLTAVEAAFVAHSLGTATLTGSYTPP